MLLDAHIHTDKYDDRLFPALANQCDLNDIALLSVSMCIPSYMRIEALAKEYDFIIPSFGIHPWKADDYAGCLSDLDKYLEKADYIGEIGLDKKFLKYAAQYKNQEKIFEYIVSHNASKDKFLNLHTSGAELEVFSVLEKYNHHKFIVHWYAGDFSTMDKYLALGGYFTVGVEILFNQYIQEIVKKLPLNRILLETDNPSSYSWLLGENSCDGMPDLLFSIIDKICEVKLIVKEELLIELYVNQGKVLLI